MQIQHDNKNQHDEVTHGMEQKTQPEKSMSSIFTFHPNISADTPWAKPRKTS